MFKKLEEQVKVLLENTLEAHRNSMRACLCFAATRLKSEWLQDCGQITKDASRLVQHVQTIKSLSLSKQAGLSLSSTSTWNYFRRTPYLGRSRSAKDRLQNNCFCYVLLVGSWSAVWDGFDGANARHRLSLRSFICQKHSLYEKWNGERGQKMHHARGHKLIQVEKLLATGLRPTALRRCLGKYGLWL